MSVILNAKERLVFMVRKDTACAECRDSGQDD